jgi:hypothetical protein
VKEGRRRKENNEGRNENSKGTKGRKKRQGRKGGREEGTEGRSPCPTAYKEGINGRGEGRKEGRR